MVTIDYLYHVSIIIQNFFKKLSCRRNKGSQQIIQYDCHFVQWTCASVMSWLEEPGICVMLTLLYILNHSGWWPILSAFRVTQFVNPNAWLNLSFHYLPACTHFLTWHISPVRKLPGDDSENHDGRGEGRGRWEKWRERGEKKKIILYASVRALWINWLFQLVQ